MKWTDIESEVIRCTKCGACQSVCPVFKEMETESTVARGKISLMKAVIHGNVDSQAANFAERMSWCLMCKDCQQNCPSGVKFDRLMLAVRRKLTEEKGLPLLKRLIFRLGLKNRRLFDLGMNMGALSQWLLFRPGPGGEGMLPRLPMGLDQRRLVSSVASRPFRTRHPEKVEVTEPKRRVAFFTGCMVNYMYPEIGDAVLKVLAHNQVSVVIPANQHCCGTPVYVSGDVLTAIELARAVVDSFVDLEVDTVVTACGSCGTALGKEYPELLKDIPGYKEKSKVLASKVVDFSELMVDIGLGGNLTPVHKTVTYHESCHLTRGQGIKQQPRQLITSIPSVTLQEMQQPGRCCGAAGSFSLEHYDLAMRINKHKIDEVAATKADTVVTGCSMCVMQIRDGINQRGLDTKVLHTAVLLAQAYKDE